MKTLTTIFNILWLVIAIACGLAMAFLLVLFMPVVFCFVLPFIVAVVIWRLIR